MRKAGQYKKVVTVSAIVYTWAQTAKTVRETQAITIPSDLPKEVPPTPTPTSSQVDLPNPQLPNSSDLIPLARSFPYTKDPIAKTKNQDDTNSDWVDPFTPDSDLVDLPTPDIEFDPGLYHSNPSFFHSDLPPNYLPNGFIEKSIEAAEIGKLLLKIGLG